MLRLRGLLMAVLWPGMPSAAAAHGFDLTGKYLAVGPSVGTARFGKHRAPHAGAELSIGNIGWDYGYGAWLDYQRAFGSLDHHRLGVGLQLTNGQIAMLGIDVGYLVLFQGSSAHSGMRARVFLTSGVIGLAGGGGWVEELGNFTELTLLVKFPFSPAMYDSLGF